MADSILRLRVDSQEYDNKIKRAAEGIQRYAQKCREAGGTLTALDDGVLDFIQNLGKMDTVASNTRGGLREITQALSDLTITYRNLTDEEKASPFGQELAKGIDQLTQRAGQARDAMKDVERSIQAQASDTRVFDQLSQGASVATAGFQTLTGTLNLLGVKMGDDVKVIATLQSAIAITNGLTTIQNALQKESALMQGLNAAKAAVSAAAHAILAKELTAAAVAQTALNVAMKAAPWMIGISLVAGLCDVLGLFSSNTDTAGDSLADFNKKLDLTDEKIKSIETHLESVVNYMQQIGSPSKDVINAQLKAAYEELEAAQEDYNKLVNNSGGFSQSSTFGSAIKSINAVLVPESIKEEALKKIQTAADKVEKLEQKLWDAEQAGEYFDKNWFKLKSEKKIEAAINYFTTLRKELDQGTESWNKYNDRIVALQAKLPKNNTTGRTTVSHTSSTTKELTENQQLQKNIEALTKEYQQLSDVEKVADVNTATGIEMRKAAIRGEIQANQQRIDELKKFADEAQGKNIELKVDIVPVNGSSFTQESISKYVQELQKQLSSLDMSMGGASAMANDLYANIIDAQTFGNLLKTSIQHGIDLAAVGIDTTSLWEQITNGDGLEDADWKGFVEKINEQLKKQGIKLNIDPQTGNISTDKKEKNTTSKALEKFNGDFSKLTGGVSSIVSGIQSMGVEIPKSIQSIMGVLTGISSIMSGIASILTVIEATTTIAAAKPFANGGVIHAAGGWSGFVPGNSFSGDNVPALLNSGELVLNRFQQQALAGTLENGGMKNITISGALRGEDIVLSADRWGKRTGKGELLFAKNL